MSTSSSTSTSAPSADDDFARRATGDLGASGVLPYILRETSALAEPTADSDPFAAPAGWFYDLDLWDAMVAQLDTAFGPTFQHCLALKSQSLEGLFTLPSTLKHGIGAECASLGEVALALDLFQMPPDKIVFDSPIKTLAELKFSLERAIHINLDNLAECERVAEMLQADPALAAKAGVVGLRINPLVGAGEIGALSVSTAASKFGIPLSRRDELLEAYAQHAFLNCVHVHVGSGWKEPSGAYEKLTAGIRAAVDLAVEVNRRAGKAQVTVLDIGGGMPVNYRSDPWTDSGAPTHATYAAYLRKEVPELFSGDFKVVTEFGQSANAKLAFLASRVEYVKGTDELPILAVHFGADCCVRQAYTGDHTRRLELYDGATGQSAQDAAEDEMVATNVAGPLCFQGDFVGKGVMFPRKMLKPGNILAMKDAGANTLSIFSRHCARVAPPVYGYRRNAEGQVVEFVTLKPRESIDSLKTFWSK